MDIAAVYGKFRGSKAFLVGLCSFIVIWMTLHFLVPVFDPEMGFINLILSAESSISLAFFAYLSSIQDDKIEAAITRIEGIVRGTHEHVEDIHEEVVEDENEPS